MREHTAYGLSPDQAQKMFASFVEKRACIMENEPGGPVEGTKPRRHNPSEPVQVVSTIPPGGHEGRGGSASSPRLEELARSVRLPAIHTGTYEKGDLLREIKKASEFMADDHYPIQKRVRAGRTATGHLPPAPGTNDRIVEGPLRAGDIERLTKTAAPGIPPTPLAAMAEETQEPEIGSKPGRAGMVTDYATRAAVGAGVGRTLGFLARGALSEAAERRLGIGGAFAGLALAEASRREAKRHDEAVKALRAMAESHRGDASSGQPLRTADDQMRAILEGGARAEGLL